MTGVCRTPWKIRFSSRREAVRAISDTGISSKHGQLRPYHCTCGSWHLSKMTRRQYKTALKKRAA